MKDVSAFPERDALAARAGRDAAEGTGISQNGGDSSFVGDVLRLISGTGAAQIIGIIAAPVIARLFAPEAFGVLSLFASASTIIIIISSFRFDSPIYLPEQDADAAPVVHVCLVLVALTTAGTCFFVLLLGRTAIRALHAPELSSYIWLVPLNVFISGSVNVLSCWNMRKKHFTRITVLQLANRVALTAAQILLGLAGFVTGGTLIITTIFGAVVELVTLASMTLRDSPRVLLYNISARSMRFVVRRYRRFPAYGLPATVFNSVSWQLPAILLSGFFNPAVVGQYAFSTRLLRVPANLIGSSFNRALFPRLAVARHAGTLAPSVELALRHLISLSFLPCLLLTLVGKDLFLFAFGPKWSEAGLYTQILSVWLFFWFIAAPLSGTLAVLEQQTVELYFQIANVATRFLSLLAGGLYGNARVAIALFAISGVCIYGSYCYVVLRKAGTSLTAVLRAIGINALACTPIGALVLFLRLLHTSRITLLIVAACLAAAFYANRFRSEPLVRDVLRRLAGRALFATR